MPSKRRPITSYVDVAITRGQYYKFIETDLINQSSKDHELPPPLSIDTITGRESQEWKLYGECRNADLAIFFSVEAKEMKEAKAICAGCPVKEPCLDYALENNVRGIWGDTTERQRRSINSRRR